MYVCVAKTNAVQRKRRQKKHDLRNGVHNLINRASTPDINIKHMINNVLFIFLTYKLKYLIFYVEF